MSRKVDLQADKLIVMLTGLTSAAALKRHLEIPYAAIKKVDSGAFKTSAFTPRVGTANMGNNIREGRFFIDGEWCFLSYEKHDKVVILDLEGFDYRRVIFEVVNPPAIKEAIQQRCPHLA